MDSNIMCNVRNERQSTDILLRCIEVQQERGKEHTDTEKERNMKKIVEVFNSLTGKNLSELEGNLFMVCLKLVRLNREKYHEDSFIDCINYLSLAAEFKSRDTKN